MCVKGIGVEVVLKGVVVCVKGISVEGRGAVRVEGIGVEVVLKGVVLCVLQA